MPAKALKTVLIVDDERDLVEPLALRLAADGRFEVSTAFDGEDGLRKAADLRPDAALVDLAMPGIDGWRLCRRLHEDSRTRHTRVIIMTAWVSKDLESRALAEGVTKVLLKPFEDAELLETLTAEQAAATPAGEGGAAP